LEASPGLIEAVVLLALAAAGLAATERLRLPSVVGFLLVGALAGPGALGLVSEPDRVRSLAELGVVFLLFEIGLELPLERIRHLWRSALVAGGFQIVVTLGAVAAGAHALGLGWAPALVVGAGVAMSSTAIVLRLLSDEGQIDAPGGQLAVSILLIQDLAIVPFLLCVPLLAGEARGPGEVLFAIARMAVALAIVGFGVWFLVPRLLDRVAQARGGELFSLLALLLVLGSALVAEELGLTLAVGAFLAGVAASASPYAHQLFSEVVPLRGVLLGIFFTAVGMFFEPAQIAAAPLRLLIDVLIIMSGKMLIVTIAAVWLLRRSLRVGLESGLALCQMGEFSFILLGVAAQAGLIEPLVQQRFVAASIVTLLISPFLIRFAPAIAGVVSERLSHPGAALPDEARADEETARQRVVVIGFGPAGQTLVRLLRSLDVPFIAVDANPSAAVEAGRTGEPVIYGDATRPQLLSHLQVDEARLVVVAISDPLATRRIVSRIRAMAPETPILARTRYVREVDRLSMAGANVVVAEEFEGSIELVARALESFDVPAGAIARFTEALREEGYGAIRAPAALPIDPWVMELLDHTDTDWLELPMELGSPPTLGALDVRARSGCSILVVERGANSHPNPPPDFALEAGDRLLVLGGAENLLRLRHLIEAAVGAGQAASGGATASDPT
jgi:CPA2 family monovalent cation:H+ antiporter-2